MLFGLTVLLRGGLGFLLCYEVEAAFGCLDCLLFHFFFPWSSSVLIGEGFSGLRLFSCFTTAAAASFTLGAHKSYSYVNTFFLFYRHCCSLLFYPS